MTVHPIQPHPIKLGTSCLDRRVSTEPRREFVRTWSKLLINLEINVEIL